MNPLRRCLKSLKDGTVPVTFKTREPMSLLVVFSGALREESKEGGFKIWAEKVTKKFQRRTICKGSNLNDAKIRGDPENRSGKMELIADATSQDIYTYMMYVVGNFNNHDQLKVNKPSSSV